MVPVRLFLANDNLLRSFNCINPLPIFPDNPNPSRTSADTLLDLGLHLTPSHLQGLSSSSFHEDNLFSGS
ncbi:hypothetical protein HanRHA438_Chr14g0679281 [Helianthus annuus]|nr:hypothetical protein HanRHA438_Chr14g0679281 [Helianthus annuus]